MFWWYLIIATVIALAPVILLRILHTELFPSLLEDVKLCENKAREKDILESIKKPFSRKEEEKEEVYPNIPVMHSRSSYAFSHEEGFGRLILSGKYLGASAVDVENERTLRRNTWMKKKSKPFKQNEEKGVKKKTLIQSSLREGLSTGLGVIIGASGGSGHNEVSPVDEPTHSPHESSTAPLVSEKDDPEGNTSLEEIEL